LPPEVMFGIWFDQIRAIAWEESVLATTPAFTNSLGAEWSQGNS